MDAKILFPSPRISNVLNSVKNSIQGGDVSFEGRLSLSERKSERISLELSTCNLLKYCANFPVQSSKYCKFYLQIKSSFSNFCVLFICLYC